MNARVVYIGDNYAGADLVEVSLRLGQRGFSHLVTEDEDAGDYFVSDQYMNLREYEKSFLRMQVRMQARMLEQDAKFRLESFEHDSIIIEIVKLESVLDQG